MKKRVVLPSILAIVSAMLLTLTFCVTDNLTALAEDFTFPFDGMPPGGPPPVSSAPGSAAYYILDGERVSTNELATSKYTIGDEGTLVKGEDGTWTFTDFLIKSGLYDFNGIIATGSSSKVVLDNCKIDLTVDTPVTADETGSTPTGGCAIGIDNGASMFINNSLLRVAGAGRYVTSNYGNGTLVINNSKIDSDGNVSNTDSITAPFSNEALLISGTARSNFSIGASDTYYFNSKCLAEGWAALSTDSATGDGLDLYAYNTKAVAENGGYATYADTNCRVWLYGSKLDAAEIGAIIAKSGAIHVYDGLMASEELLTYKAENGDTTTEATTITGGRNAVMMHAPDMMGQGIAAVDCGTLEVINSTLVTSKKLVSTFDYEAAYGLAISDYIDYISGAAILVKSTSADITLNSAKIKSYSNVILQTVLNSDKMGNFLADGDANSEAVKPVSLTMKNMTQKGDILHMDYQRNMVISLENTTLTGKIISGSMEDWNVLWSGYSENLNWVVDSEWNSVYGASLTLKSDSTWKVTGESTLTSLTVEDGSKIIGIVTVDGVKVTPTAGSLYEGNIVVKASK